MFNLLRYFGYYNINNIDPQRIRIPLDRYIRVCGHIVREHKLGSEIRYI